MWKFGKIDIIILITLNIIWDAFSKKLSKILRTIIVCITCVIALLFWVASYNVVNNKMGVLSYSFMSVFAVTGLFAMELIGRCFWFKRKLEEFDGWGDVVFTSSVGMIWLVNMMLYFF